MSQLKRINIAFHRKRSHDCVRCLNYNAYRLFAEHLVNNSNVLVNKRSRVLQICTRRVV